MKAKNILKILGVCFLLVLVVACVLGGLHYFDKVTGDLDSVLDDLKDNSSNNGSDNSQDDGDNFNPIEDSIELSIYINKEKFDTEGSYSISKIEDLAIEVLNGDEIFTDYTITVLHNPNVTDFVYLGDKSEYSFKQEDFKKYITTTVVDGVITLSCDYTFTEIMLDKYPSLSECYVKDFSTVDLYEGLFVLRIQVNNNDAYIDIPFNFDGWLGLKLNLSKEVIHI